MTRDADCRKLAHIGQPHPVDKWTNVLVVKFLVAGSHIQIHRLWLWHKTVVVVRSQIWQGKVGFAGGWILVLPCMCHLLLVKKKYMMCIWPLFYRRQDFTRFSLSSKHGYLWIPEPEIFVGGEGIYLGWLHTWQSQGTPLLNPCRLVFILCGTLFYVTVTFLSSHQKNNILTQKWGSVLTAPPHFYHRWIFQSAWWLFSRPQLVRGISSSCVYSARLKSQWVMFMCWSGHDY